MAMLALMERLSAKERVVDVLREAFGHSRGEMCISLGRRDGIIQPVTSDDGAKETAITGRAAARIEELMCAGAGWSILHPTMMVPSRRRRVTAAGTAGAVPVGGPTSEMSR